MVFRKGVAQNPDSRPQGPRPNLDLAEPVWQCRDPMPSADLDDGHPT
jgi:hypothetical protein